MYHNFVANVITSDVKTVTERRDRTGNNQLAFVLLLAIPYHGDFINISFLSSRNQLGI